MSIFIVGILISNVSIPKEKSMIPKNEYMLFTLCMA